VPADVPDIAAILVNYNAGPELRYALRSIADELSDRDWEAVVVDNDSVDGSGSIAHEFAPHVRLLRNDDNLGFGRGVNQGLAATSASTVLIMNPDCRLEPGALAALEDELRRRPRCALVGPRILNPDGSVQGSARGDPDMLTGFFGRSTALRRLLPWLPVAQRNVVDNTVAAGAPSVVVDWLSGACVLAKREALATVGGFDERYFLYWEDADLCRRLRAQGHHVRYVPAATAVHRVGHSSKTARGPSVRAFHDSAYLYYATHVAPAPLNPAPLDTPSFEHASAQPGVEQCFVVRTVETVGSATVESEPSQPACVTPRDTFPPAAPKNLSAVAGPGAINLIWDANTEGDLAGYLILRGPAPGDTLQPLNAEPTRDTRFRDTTVSPGAHYVYAIIAVDRAGNRSAASPPVEETAR